jgi:N-acetylmuramic acid 6-phosphate (MurNAc-6-P) etherase
MGIALIMLKSGATARGAQRRLRNADGNVRNALILEGQAPKGPQKRHG